MKALSSLTPTDSPAAAARHIALYGFALLDHAPDGGHRLSLQGRFSLSHAGDLWQQIRRDVGRLRRGDRLDIDMSAVDAIDGGTMAILVHVRSQLLARGIATEFTGGAEDIQALVHLYEGDAEPTPRRRRRPETFLAQVGRSTIEFVLAIKGVLGFLGAVIKATLGLLKEPRTGNWKDVMPTMERAGADALPIVVLINFLVGFVLAYQASAQLKQFGADLYVADLVGKSVTREMGPLMTAIILCGRSGAAFAAELGSMTVSEEVDALRTMGFGPIRYLVLPRTIALMLVLPVLTVIADFIGVFGGFVVATHRLGLSAIAYFHRIQDSIVFWDIASGAIKSVAFAAAIAIIACQQGFAATGGAEGVGRRTTSAVVSILFALILIDAGFTVFFAAYNL